MKSFPSNLSGYILKIPTHMDIKKDKAGRAKKGYIYIYIFLLFSCISPPQPKWKLPFTAGHSSQPRSHQRPWYCRTKQRPATSSWVLATQKMLVHPLSNSPLSNSQRRRRGERHLQAPCRLLFSLTFTQQRHKVNMKQSALSCIHLPLFPFTSSTVSQWAG